MIVEKKVDRVAFNQPEQIVDKMRELGVKKVHYRLVRTLVLGFLAGAYISFGFLLYIRVTAQLPLDLWGSFATLIGAAVFPLGLIFVLIAGGELLTGNMMALVVALFAREIKLTHIVKNWTIIAISNFIGSLFVAYFFGHYLGLTEGEHYLEATIHVAAMKVNEPSLKAIISGIGANWLVCLAVWLAYAAEDVAGKILGIWFPIMAFVAIGFQHVVANMFIIPAAIFAGYFTWFDFLENFIAVFSGNAIGGAIFVGGFYWVAYANE